MNSKTLLFVLYYCFLGLVSAQNISIRSKCLFPNIVRESSGITTINNGASFWTHNDSDSGPEIYEIDSNCIHIRTLKFTNSKPDDWEAITHDDKGNLYLGDFGNNSNIRTNLKIWKILDADNKISDQRTAQIINFKYANQTNFPPVASKLYYDGEAFFYYQDSLHIFSKNRSNPFDGLTYHYVIPTEAGSYVLKPRDSIVLGTASVYQYWITDAAISPKQNKIALLSSDRIFLFYDFVGDNFFKGKMKEITLSNFSQKEGVTFANEHQLWLSEEGGLQGSQAANLYVADIYEFFTANKDIPMAKQKQNCLRMTHSDLKQLLQSNPEFKLSSLFGNIFTENQSLDLPLGLYLLIDRTRSRTMAIMLTD